MNKPATKKQNAGPIAKAAGQAPRATDRVASKASLAAAEFRSHKAAMDRGPEAHPDAPVPHSGTKPGVVKSAAARDQATHTIKQRQGVKRDGF